MCTVAVRPGPLKCNFVWPNPNFVHPSTCVQGRDTRHTHRIPEREGSQENGYVPARGRFRTRLEVIGYSMIFGKLVAIL